MAKQAMVGVVGAGSFGTTVSMLLSHNNPVLLYSRDAETVDRINATHEHRGHLLSSEIRATNSIEEICGDCRLIFPIVPSQTFREMMRDLAPHLHPYHILIHGTKGFDISPKSSNADREAIGLHIHTMSEVILEECSVVRVGCLSGPNLHGEIMSGLPAAGVIASKFDEVIVAGHQVLNSPRFKIYGSEDLLGTEIAGALKNTIAIASGIAGGLKMGKNIEAFLITRGLREMIIIGQSMGAKVSAYLGIAGIGDLIVSGTSPLSRNYSFGVALAKGGNPQQIIAESQQLVEGIRTIELVHQYGLGKKLDLPLMDMLYSILFQSLPIDQAISYLLEYPFAVDVDFL